MLALVIFTLGATNAMAAVVVPPIYSSGFAANSGEILGAVTDRNYNVTISNHDVVVNFLTTQYMIGSLIVDGVEIETEDAAVYHTIATTLSEGEHTIQPVAKIGARIVYGKEKTIIVE